MALVLRKIYEGYDYYFNESKDHRATNLWLINSPIPVLLILSGYFFFVSKLGPKIMENRPAFEIKNLMMFYNLIQVICNVMLGVFGFYSSYYQPNWSFSCQSVNYSDTPLGNLELRLSYLYFLLKISDLLDTIFFVLRKRYSHLSFLHLYHHAGMVLGGYICCRFVPGGHALLLGIINCFVHAVMYFYYFLTSFKPELKQSIWWKKYITQIQMVQFAILIIHFGRPAVFYQSCDYPKFWMWMGLIQNLFMLLLFSNFYKRAYLKPKPKPKPKVN